jgi:hypothetical protein
VSAGENASAAGIPVPGDPAVAMVYGIIVVLFVMAALAWGAGALRSRRWMWPRLIHRMYRDPIYVGAGAVLVAAFGLAVSMTFAALLMRWNSTHMPGLLTSSGTLAALVGGILTTMTFFNQLILTTKQDQQMPTIRALLKEVNKTLESTLSGPIEQVRSSPHSFYMMDYAPGIGLKAAPDEYKRLMENIDLMKSFKKFKMTMVFYPEARIGRFHEDMDTNENDILAVQAKAAQLDTVKAVWRSDAIGPMHIIVIDDVAFQYVVLPEGGGKQSKAVGFKTEDVSQVGFLQETIGHTIHAAATPALKWTDDEQELRLTLPTPQTNLRTAKIELRLDDKFPAEPEPAMSIEVDCQLIEWSLAASKVDSMRFLRVTLEKTVVDDSTPRYAHSRIVEIPQRKLKPAQTGTAS